MLHKYMRFPGSILRWGELTMMSFELNLRDLGEG